MRFNEQWLREWVNPSVETEALGHQLTMAGLEVDAIEPVAGAFTGVVVGEVLSVEPHPDADKLRVTTVNVGADEPLTIVCGAANVRPGLRVPCATIGAVLPGDFKIKKSKLRGVPSHGMLCSDKELGLAESSDGLMELPLDAPVGEDFRVYLGLDDVAIELGLTPNRSDCLCIAGIAREVGVLCDVPVTPPTIAPVAAAIDDTFSVTLTAPSACPRYVGRVVRGIDPAATTPLWMQEKLRRCGLRSLGPVVDVTNYILLELGQPMHGFDLAKLSGGIQVRMAEQGEKLELLNGSEVTLNAGSLVIADQNGPLALAGIMGGEPSSVTDATVDIFFESAFFSPEAIAGKAREYGLHTDSSHRFERGVSPAGQVDAIERATALLVAICGGQPGPLVVAEVSTHLPKRPPVRLRAERIERILGAAIPEARVTAILERLDMQVESADGEWLVTPPAHRFDIEIEVDLIEEVGRIYGYDNLPTSLPHANLHMAEQPEGLLRTLRLKEHLVALGYQEAITYSFVEPKVQSLLDPANPAVELANPISADMAVMRTTLWAGLIPAARHNLNRQQERVRLFESGLRFQVEHGAELPRQTEGLAGIVVGSALPEQWGTARRAYDFFDLKGEVESLLGLLPQGEAYRFEVASHPALHPGRSARILRGETHIGWLGALHPSLAKPLDLPAATWLFELELDALGRAALPAFRELSRFPAVRRDLSFFIDRGVNAAAILDCVADVAPDSLQQLKLFDVYEGEHIDSGRKSVALGLILQAQSSTLTDSEIDAIVEPVIAALRDRLGATLRDK